jgi:hypothetical protein
VTVRMYKQGLGDCFLLTFPRAARPFHMLIDCGALNSKRYDAELMKRVVRDIKETTGGRLDVVAVTHEHWDHISGFYQAKEVFDEIEVGRVWTAWTDDPDNEAARQIKGEFKKRKNAVGQALARIPEGKKGDSQMGLYKKAVSELFNFFGVGAAGQGYAEQAWDYVINEKGRGRPLYCDPKNTPIEGEGVEGVRIYVLGPPADPDYIRKLLSKTETYDTGQKATSPFDGFVAAVMSGDQGGDDQLAHPFDKRYRVRSSEAEHTPFFREHYGFDERDGGEWRRIEHDWLNLAGELALQLDSYTNNACLAMAVELIDSGEVLLFPGDAQVGNWLSWGDLSWKVKEAGGEVKTVTIDDLLASTVLYKVGHHGSHNATLRCKGLEKMSHPNLVAMIPVHRQTAEDQSWAFPYPPLWKRLREKARGRVMLADAKDVDEVVADAEKVLSQDETKSFRNAIEFTELYIQYRITY